MLRTKFPAVVFAKRADDIRPYGGCGRFYYNTVGAHLVRPLIGRGYNPSVAFGDSLVTLLSSSPTFPLIGESSLHKGAYSPGRLFRNAIGATLAVAR